MRPSEDGGLDSTRFLGLGAECRTHEIKKAVLARFRDGFEVLAAMLISTGADTDSMAKTVNARSNTILETLTAELPVGDPAFLARAAVVVSYCHAVASIECRHRVWPYNLLDFSRRIGELWQATCLVAWTYATAPDMVNVADPPAFPDVRRRMLSDLWDLFHDHPNVEAGVDMVDAFTARMDGISMISDKLFHKADVPNVIDFKFAFKSNEKGNKNRVGELGWAYRQWNRDTRLCLVVCHTENNNYLRQLKDEGVWDVVTGRDAYALIGRHTGFDLLGLLDSCVDFRADLDVEFVKYIDHHHDNLCCSIDWQTDLSKVDRCPGETPRVVTV